MSSEHNFGRLSFNRELKVGDILTITTILISLLSVLVSWDIDRQMRLRKEANDIRLAAAETLGDLERWRNLSLSIFDDLQPVFVDASQIAAAVPNKLSSRTDKVRQGLDLLWKRINEIHSGIVERILADKLEGGYTRLFGYYPEVRDLYQRTLRKMSSVDSEMEVALLLKTEESIVSFAHTQADLRSDEVGNALRNAAAKVRPGYEVELRDAMKEAEAFLVDRIGRSDRTLLRGSGAPP